MRKLFWFIALLSNFTLFGQEWDVILDPYEVIETRALQASQTRDWGHVYLQAREFKGEGNGVYVFVADTGVDQDHPDLKGNIDSRYCKDFTGSASGWDDIHGHGTHCAGIIGAIDNNEGVIGIAPKIKIVAIKVLNDNGQGSYTNIITGIRYVADLQIPGNPKKIISMSLGGSSTTQAFEDAINYAISKGCFIVAAAGNSYGGPIGHPGKYKQVITVGSIGKTAQPSDFSSAGEEMDLAAPGEEIYSTHRNGSYARLNGTSMAAPQVTGIIAKLLSRYDIKTQKEMEEYLRKYASDLYDKGFDKRTGYGAPIATNYNEGPDGGDPNPDPDPDPEPDPIVSYKKRVVSIPVRSYYDNILFKSNTDGAYRYMSVGGIVVEYTTTKSSKTASEDINRLADNFFTRRGFILPQDQTDLDFTAAWAAYFFKLILKNEGYEINISEMWAAEGLSDDRTLVYYTKNYPVGSKVNEKQLVKIRNAKKMERRGQVATLGWSN